MVAYVLAIAPKVGAAFVDFCIEEFKFCEDLWANGPRSVSSPTGLLGWGGETKSFYVVRFVEPQGVINEGASSLHEWLPCEE